jgi:hypothetical protein
MLVRVVGTVLAFLLISGLLVQQAIELIPQPRQELARRRPRQRHLPDHGGAAARSRSSRRAMC